MDAIDIGQRIKYCRKNQKMSREELADKLGLSKFAIAKYEQGQRKPDGVMLIKIASALGLEVAYFLETKTIKSKRLINILSSKNITNNTLITELNIDENIFNQLLNNCEIKTVQEQETLNKISDYLNINPNYLLGETDFKSYEDSEFNSLEIMLDHVKVTNCDEIRYIFRDLLDTLRCILIDPVLGNKVQELQYVQNLLHPIYDVIQPLSSNANSIFCNDFKEGEKALTKEEIENITNKAKQDFSKQIDLIASYFQDIDSWSKDFHYEDTYPYDTEE